LERETRLELAPFSLEGRHLRLHRRRTAQPSKTQSSDFVADLLEPAYASDDVMFILVQPVDHLAQDDVGDLGVLLYQHIELPERQ
jgi:hypothetical protein